MGSTVYYALEIQRWVRQDLYQLIDSEEMQMVLYNTR